MTRPLFHTNQVRRDFPLLGGTVEAANSRTRFAAFGVGVKNGAGWRSGEGARMISVVMRWISAAFTGPLPGRQACDKGRYHTQNNGR